MLVVSIIIYVRDEFVRNDIPTLLQATSQKKCVELVKLHMQAAHEVNECLEPEDVAKLHAATTYAELKTWFDDCYAYYTLSYCEADLF